MQYIQVLNNLQQSINHKHNNELFIKSITQLKQNFGQEISTKFLRGLCVFSDFRRKTKRISYLLRATGLKTKREYRPYSYLDWHTFKTDVTEYANTFKKDVYEEFIQGDLSDKATRKDRAILKKWGFKEEELKQMPSESVNYFLRQHTNNLREAINHSGKAFIKNVRSQEVGKEYWKGGNEVLFMIEVA